MFKQGDRVKSTQYGCTGYYLEGHGGREIIECDTKTGGWPRDSSIPSEYISKGADCYLYINAAGLVPVTTKWNGIGAVPEKWYVIWNEQQDCMDTKDHFKNRMLWVKGGVIDYKGGWKGCIDRKVGGMFTPKAREVEISMEQFRQHIMKKAPPIKERENPWGFKRGDIVNYRGERAYFVGPNPIYNNFMIEYPFGSDKGWPKDREERQIPKDYVHIGADRYWNIGKEEKLERWIEPYVEKNPCLKQEEEKWAIRITPENKEKVRKWFHNRELAKGSGFSNGFYYHFPTFALGNYWGSAALKPGYKEIDTCEFDRRFEDVPGKEEKKFYVEIPQLRPDPGHKHWFVDEAGQWPMPRAKEFTGAMDAYGKMQQVAEQVKPGVVGLWAQMKSAPIIEYNREGISEAIRDMLYGKDKYIERLPTAVIMPMKTKKKRNLL